MTTPNSRLPKVSLPLRYVLGVVGTLAVAYVLMFWLFFAGSQFTPSNNEAAALAALRQPTPPVSGRDGTNALWVHGYDVPAADRDRVGAAVRSYYDRVDAEGLPADATNPAFGNNPLAAYKKFPEVRGDTPGLCRDNDIACLPTVRAHLPATLVTLAQHRAGLQAALDLTSYDGFRYGVRPSSTQHLPSPGKQGALVRAHFAAMYLQGRPAEAMAGVCGDIRGWRRMGGNTDYLIGNLIGLAYVRQDLVLLAEMMSGLPATESLPPPCAAALVPTTPAEQDMCPAMRNEFLSFETTIVRSFRPRRPDGADAVVLQRIVNQEHLLAKVAPVYGAACDPVLRKQAATDRSWRTLVPAWPECSLRDAIADPAGCAILAASDGVGWSRYLDRRTDLEAQLSLLRTVDWLRTQGVDPAQWPARLAARPSGLGLVRAPVIAADGKTIAIRLFYQGRGKMFRVALPMPIAEAHATSP